MISIKVSRPSWRILMLAQVLLLVLSIPLGGQDLAPPSARDIWQIGQQELRFLNALPQSPQGFLMGAYTQNFGSRGEVVSDSWKLARVSHGPNGFAIVDLALPPAFPPLPDRGAGREKASRSHTPIKPRASPPLPESPIMEGLAYMTSPDSAGIGTDRYLFKYLGVETLGDLRTWTFLLKPKESAGLGAFEGKIWVADHNIVRFSGTFANSPRQKGTYVAFDNVRYKTANGHWKPWRTYLDQTGLPPYAPSSRAFRALISMWGFDSQAAGISGAVGVEVDDKVDSTHAYGTQSSEDVYLEAERNFVQWLERIGLMAPRGKFERDICDPIIQDIVTANHVTLDRRLSCRTLLSEPAETVLFESIIGVSKTIFDLAPNTATVAVLLAREVALAKVRRQRLDLAWGRPDTLLRDELDLIKFVGITPPQNERDEADDLALKYLERLKQYKPEDLETAGIFLYTASEACKAMPALFTPKFGDGLPGCGRDAHISQMALPAPPGSDQNPAMHIGSRTEVNPSSDLVMLITAQQEHAPFRIIPEPMIPGLVPDDPDEKDQDIVQPGLLLHLAPSPALPATKKR